MASILFTDSDGSWKLHNAKPFPADRFQGWTPDHIPFGDSAPRLSDGAITMLRLRDDFGVSLSIPMIPSQRLSNAAVRSEEMEHASWVKTNVTVGANQTRGADTSITADKVGETAVSGLHLVEQTPTLVDNTVYRYAAFVRPIERTWVRFGVGRKDGSSATAFFQLTGDGSVGTLLGSPTTTIRKAWNGFYYVALTTNVLAGGSPTVFNIALATGDTVISYLGVSGSGVVLWGAQVSPASLAEHYLYTAGAAVLSASLVDIADRLKRHLLNGGTCTLYTGDANDTAYATVGLKHGTVPQLTLSDARALEYTFSAQFINLATSPVRMSAYYADQ